MRVSPKSIVQSTPPASSAGGVSVCPACGLTRHPKGCPKRKRSGLHLPRTVWGVDCETANDKIVLFLAAGERGDSSHIYHPDGLSFETVCNWLVELPPKPLFCGFYFDYDANQIIRLLPPLHQAQLAKLMRVSYGGFQIRHTPGKRFSVRRLHDNRRITVWDVSGWAQCSFATLCDQWQLGTEPERAEVKAMKARRGTFETATRNELVRYTTLECKLLSQWVRIVLNLHDECNISLRAYTGPGATASALMRREGWKPPAIPETVRSIAERAYYGGRSEISCMGPVSGQVYGYDINSAYPRAIAELPKINEAQWFKAQSYDPQAWGFWFVRWTLPELSPWGPFPTRSAILPGGRKSVSLLYPLTGSGWYHSCEVTAALEVCAPGSIEVLGGLVIYPQGAPFAWVADLAATRLEYKRKGDMRAFPLKVGLNSLYGKLAQRSGVAPLQCMPYAAAITAHTRAALMRIAFRYGHSVHLLATDGILMSTPADVELGSGLGQWELERYDSAFFLQAGVYWAGSKQRSRGIDARALSLEDTAALWSKRKTRATVALPVRRVLSYRLCAHQNKLHLTGTWVESMREVRFTPEPRRRAWKWVDGRLLTLPARVAEYTASAAWDGYIMDGNGTPDEFEALPEWSRD